MWLDPHAAGLHDMRCEKKALTRVDHAAHVQFPVYVHGAEQLACVRRSCFDLCMVRRGQIRENTAFQCNLRYTLGDCYEVLGAGSGAHKPFD